MAVLLPALELRSHVHSRAPQVPALRVPSEGRLGFCAHGPVWLASARAVGTRTPGDNLWVSGNTCVEVDGPSLFVLEF